MVFFIIGSLFLSVSISPLMAASNQAKSTYGGEYDKKLLDSGYSANEITIDGKAAFAASQKRYKDQTWSRDLDYAVQGYSYVLHDMSNLKQNIELFLERTTTDGVVPEVVYGGSSAWVKNNYHTSCGTNKDYGKYKKWVCGSDYVNRESWDSMPNIISATYHYIAKTGDKNFYNKYQYKLDAIGSWIGNLDTNGDGLPDKDIYPYGYYDSTTNGVKHTYAIAKFYGAYNQLAELSGDGKWSSKAEKLKESFLNSSQYWPSGQAWPISWVKQDGVVVNTPETFGMFEAIRLGLITQGDKHYDDLVQYLQNNKDEMLRDKYPMKLTIGGYTDFDSIKRQREGIQNWMGHVSAPWVSGPAVQIFSSVSRYDIVRDILNKYKRMVDETNPPVIEFMNGTNYSTNEHNEIDGGRFWDTAAWFMAVYGGYYGLDMKLNSLVVAPKPLASLRNDGIQNFTYQGAEINMLVFSNEQKYTIETNKPIPVILKPMGSGEQVSVNGGELTPQYHGTLFADRTYTVIADYQGSSEEPSSPEPSDTEESPVPDEPEESPSDEPEEREEPDDETSPSDPDDTEQHSDEGSSAPETEGCKDDEEGNSTKNTCQSCPINKRTKEFYCQAYALYYGESCPCE